MRLVGPCNQSIEQKPWGQSSGHRCGRSLRYNNVENGRKDALIHLKNNVEKGMYRDLPSGSRVLARSVIQLPITKWPHQSEAPVGAVPPTRSQLRLQRQT
jgi:hypothetical protein